MSKKIKLSQKQIRNLLGKSIKITLEIIVKENNEQLSTVSLSGGADKASIKYEFTRDQITLINISIENKSVPTPADTGNVELDFIPLSGQITVSAIATGNGTGTLQLIYLGKNLLTQPIDFNFSGGHGTINQLVKIG
ncbi:hypothetical protein SAMN04487995_4578 [Dyadobacter koreensis]|uniref:Uncharacterized protein n=1 Tax=Dyadobacter koreensis TaxID=408657 RepID=A0A1H6YJU5_9BACT|nr:hypothetical protein [Dyadobacter koreensis]SEJ41593.1 hypothetical protein SAMN04487995_4578 [Dyadobacter koreensis]